MTVGLVTAFLGGALALLSPCAALLLPAFFAAKVSSARGQLLMHAAVFYVGLVTVLVPVGIGVGAIGVFFAKHRAEVVAVTAVVLIVLGVAQAFGKGFDIADAVPGLRSLQASGARLRGLPQSFVLGAAGGVAGFCAGPILGAVLTIAAAQGQVVHAGVLLAMYAAGMVAPLIVIAWGWEALGDQGRRALRGRQFEALGRQWHTTSLITGLVLVIAGVLFWFTNGLVSAPELLPAGLRSWLQDGALGLSSPIVDAIAVIAAAIIALALWNSWQIKRQRPRDTEARD